MVLCMNIHIIFICNVQKLESICMFLKCWMVKQIVSLHNGISLGNKKEWTIDAGNNIDGSQKLSERSQIIKNTSCSITLK